LSDRRTGDRREDARGVREPRETWRRSPSLGGRSASGCPAPSAYGGPTDHLWFRVREGGAGGRCARRLHRWGQRQRNPLPVVDTASRIRHVVDATPVRRSINRSAGQYYQRMPGLSLKPASSTMPSQMQKVSTTPTRTAVERFLRAIIQKYNEVPTAMPTIIPNR
jgi:hypothetical protein